MRRVQRSKRNGRGFPNRRLRLTKPQEELLLEVLQDHQKHLLHEIARADHHEFKDRLLKRYAVLEEVLGKLNVQVGSAP